MLAFKALSPGNLFILYKKRLPKLSFSHLPLIHYINPVRYKIKRSFLMANLEKIFLFISYILKCSLLCQCIGGPLVTTLIFIFPFQYRLNNSIYICIPNIMVSFYNVQFMISRIKIQLILMRSSPCKHSLCIL